MSAGKIRKVVTAWRLAINGCVASAASVHQAKKAQTFISYTNRQIIQSQSEAHKAKVNWWQWRWWWWLKCESHCHVRIVGQQSLKERKWMRELISRLVHTNTHKHNWQVYLFGVSLSNPPLPLQRTFVSFSPPPVALFLVSFPSLPLDWLFALLPPSNVTHSAAVVCFLRLFAWLPFLLSFYLALFLSFFFFFSFSLQSSPAAAN